MILPSKELLSAVIDVEVIEIYDYDTEIAVKYIDCTDSELVSIYELMHLMKGWAINKGFVVLSRNDSIGYRWTVILSIPSNLNFNKSFEQLSEFEAVTKACEWVLEQK